MEASELKALSNAVSSGFAKVNANFESISKELKHVHARLDQLSRKVDSLKGDTNNGFGNVGLQLETLTEEIAKIEEVKTYSEHFRIMRVIR